MREAHSFQRAGVILAMGLVVALSSAAQAETPGGGWYGSYSHDELIPRSGGTTASIKTRITLSDAGCRIDATGLQTDTHIRCTAKMQGKNLQIRFKSYADGGLKNQYGIARFKPGQPLLMLTRTPDGFITTWQGYTPSDGNAGRGKFFKKELG